MFHRFSISPSLFHPNVFLIQRKSDRTNGEQKNASIHTIYRIIKGHWTLIVKSGGYLWTNLLLLSLTDNGLRYVCILLLSVKLVIFIARIDYNSISFDVRQPPSHRYTLFIIMRALSWKLSVVCIFGWVTLTCLNVLFIDFFRRLHGIEASPMEEEEDKMFRHERLGWVRHELKRFFFGGKVAQVRSNSAYQSSYKAALIVTCSWHFLISQPAECLLWDAIAF